jgi:sugar O-acyltransferase (sialic acid O-acetyltransferase NeuD family)
VSDKFVVIIGYSGHGYVVGEAAMASGHALKYYIDKNQNSENPFGLIYLGYEENENFKGWNPDHHYIIGIGDNAIRQKIANGIVQKRLRLLTIIHPASSIAKQTRLGSGVFIARNVAVNPMVEIGDFTILNTSSVVEHECKIGIASHIAPGAVLAGNVEVGDRTFIGANAVVKQGVKIGSDVIIGAGSVILTNISDGQTVAGNPARQIK